MTLIDARIIPGYRVASGQAGDSRFPNGTIMMQAPHFADRGLDISPYFSATINVNIAPFQFKILKPKYHFLKVKWSQHLPPEDFYFFDLIAIYTEIEYKGLIYMPDPSTKVDHIQTDDTLELLLPKIEGLQYHRPIKLRLNDDQLSLSK
jgi:hypothetical protein